VGHRIASGLVSIALIVGMTACEVRDHRTFTVDVSTDGRDAAPGDGLCEVTAGVGDCALRAAIDEVNALAASAPPGEPPRVFTIELGTDVLLTRGGVGEDDNSTGDLDIRAELTLHGNDHAVDGAQLDRVVHVLGGDVELVRLTVRNGKVSSQGGGVRVEPGARVVVIASTVADNRSTAVGTCTPDAGTCTAVDVTGGGGVSSAGDLVIVASTFRDNWAVPELDSGPTLPTCDTRWGPICPAGYGGGVLSTGSLTVVGSTFVGNAAFTLFESSHPVGRAVYAVGGVADVTQSTLVDRAAGWMQPPVHGVSAQGSILMGSACGSVTLDADFNLVQSPPCLLPQGTLRLETLADNGGWTQTVRPEPTSPAIDVIPVGTPGLCEGGTDQRGLPRLAGGGCDIGAVERQVAEG
jgi:hypothetical protein